MRAPFLLTALLLLGSLRAAMAGEPETLNLWPALPPGETAPLPAAEADLTKESENLIAGKRLIRLGNVSTPTLAIYRPAPEKDTGAAVVICPGGGHHILAYDLEGTEVAEWLNTIGVTGIVLKYRVPARHPDKRYLAAVQDAQRAVSTVRAKAADWKIDPARIGILGFSAGGETAGLAAIFEDRQYDAIDDIDKVSARPDFAVLVYPAYFVEPDTVTLKPYVKVTEKTPPMFLVHAIDDPVSASNSLMLTQALKQAKVPAELHVYSTGGHGYGLRRTEQPVTAWPDRCADWLRESKWLVKGE
jgi:acetyl esterase/lipase